MQKEELFAFRTPGMQNIGVGGMWGCVNPCAAATLCPLPAPSPVDGLGFWPWSRYLKSSFCVCHTWSCPHGQLLAMNWLWTWIAAESLWHTSGTRQLPFGSTVFPQCPAQSASPFLAFIHCFGSLGPGSGPDSGDWIQERCYVVSLFPFGSQACGFLFSYENKINGSEAILCSRISEELERQFSELALPMYKMFYNTDDVPDNEEKCSSKLKSWCPKMPLSRFLLVAEVCWHNRIGIETGQVET